VEIVELDDRVIGRETCEPGWRWSIDVKPIARTPTCQYHHVGFTVAGRLRVQMQDGLELELAPGDVFEIPPGHDAWVVGDEPWVSLDFEAMRSYARDAGDAGRRILASILMTDIVESTARAVAHGAARWRELVSRHNEIAERIANEHGGQLVQTTGDGVVARFDSGERAVHAAGALGAALRLMGIEIRAAVETGEVELAAGQVRGVTLHVAARMMTVARPGDIIVSSTVRDLLAGSSLAFADYGLHKLKGLPGERQLYRVVKARGRAIQPGAAH
jgi:class 3 adenylate cyclase